MATMFPEGNYRTFGYKTTDAASVTYTMEFAKVLAANVSNSKECYLALRSADTVSIKGSAAGLHVTLSVLEIAGRKT